SLHTVQLEDSTEAVEVGKIICIGRNYAEHAKEMKSDIPEAPVFFLKPPTALLPDGGTVVIPTLSNNMHHEVEMTVLIGREGKNIPLGAAREHVAGYGVGLDLTLRDLQDEAKKKGLPWAAAKGFDASAPVSRFIAARRVPNPHAMEVVLTVNGAERQHGKTGQLIFPVDQLIASISRLITLERGDIIFTGTPEGVAQVESGDRLEAALKNGAGETLASLTVKVQ
ncbi:MAG: fumarylacetoacetate hydrolase family protein, partial [Bacteroidota bacterium]